MLVTRGLGLGAPGWLAVAGFGLGGGTASAPAAVDTDGGGDRAPHVSRFWETSRHAEDDEVEALRADVAAQMRAAERAEREEASLPAAPHQAPPYAPALEDEDVSAARRQLAFLDRLVALRAQQAVRARQETRAAEIAERQALEDIARLAARRRLDEALAMAEAKRAHDWHELHQRMARQLEEELAIVIAQL